MMLTLHKKNSNPMEGSSQYFLGTMLSVGDMVTGKDIFHREKNQIAKKGKNGRIITEKCKAVQKHISKVMKTIVT